MLFLSLFLLLGLVEVVLDLLRRQDAELPLAFDQRDLHIVLVHLGHEALLEREDGGVNRVLQLDLLVVALLQERLGTRKALADRGGLPGCFFWGGGAGRQGQV